MEKNLRYGKIDDTIFKDSTIAYFDDAFNEIFDGISVECNSSEIGFIQRICNILAKN